MSKSEILQQLRRVPVDLMGINDRVTRIKARSIKKEAKEQGLKMALNMVDLTTLEGSDTPQKVRQLCYKAMHPHDDMPDLPTVAAICVYPTMVKTAKKALAGSKVKVASVATYFPSGQSTLEQKLEETRWTIDQGADEVDMVISRGKFLQGEYSFVLDEISAVNEVCKSNDVALKVILETGEIGSLDEVRRAADIALLADPAFIKTSTGKIGQAANMQVTLVMLQAIYDHYIRTGSMVGMKPAGGISDSKTALHYLMMVKEILGQEWLTNERFRFGASRLVNDLLMQLEKQASGNYQAPYYFSKD